MQTHLYTYDLPEDVLFSESVAIDTETMGLCVHRDRLCLMQFGAGDGNCYLVHFPQAQYNKSPNICKILKSDQILKIFHYGRFDIAVIAISFGIFPRNVYCTKIASKLVRTFTDRHSLKSLCYDLLGIEISKQSQSSDWGSSVLSQEQISYAGTDVLYLHNLKEKLDILLAREKRMDIAKACFEFLPYRVAIDIWAGETYDIFAHKT
ncbi:MAG: ribonuclease D [Holosporales bacterium]|jgi:ribonuclease D|nr:ribonuclease D [Holosporales bacterium]